MAGHADLLRRAGAALARAFVALLPRVPAVLVAPLSELVGTIAFLASPGARAAVRANHLVIAPRRRPRVRATFVNQVRNYLDTFRLLRMTSSEVDRAVDLLGWDHLATALAAGKGAVLGSAHYGPVVVCGQAVMARGHELTMPRERATSEFARAVDRARSTFGANFVSTDSAIGIHRVLRRGGILGVLADRAVTGIGERVPFFGRQALLPSAHVALALRSGAPLVAGFAHRRHGRFVAEFEPALTLPGTGDHQADVREGVARFARLMERHIAEAPEQWAVFERIWD